MTREPPLAQLESSADVMAADADGLEAALASIKARLHTALERWSGPEAGAAARRVAAEQLIGQGLLARARAQVEIVRRAAKDLGAAQARLTEVAADGAVGEDHTAAVQSALRRIADIDRRAAAELDQITARLRHPAPDAAVPDDAVPRLPAAAPAENRRFWDRLSDRQRAELIRTQPLAVGALEGLPAAARHAANFARLDPEITRWTGIRSELQVRVEASRVPALDRNRIRLWQAQRKIDDAITLKRIVSEVDGARLLSLDLHSGARGMAAISFGDTDTDDHIAVTVPGMNTNIADSFWSMSDEARQLKSLAEDLLDRAGRHGETVATVMWLGYAPPQVSGPNGALDTVVGGVAATMTSAARAGATRLAGFLAGLDAAARSHLTLLGHSYGAYTAALALQDPNPGQPVADAVFYGSPGINASDEKDLGLADGHGFVMLGDRDRINLVDNFKLFGPDPTATRLVQLSSAATTTRDGVERHAARDHADYGRAVGKDLRTSGFNMAAIVAGLSDWAIRR